MYLIGFHAECQWYRIVSNPNPYIRPRVSEDDEDAQCEGQNHDAEGDGEAEDDPDAFEESDVHRPEGRVLVSVLIHLTIHCLYRVTHQDI